jgi:hypothetical protein
MSAGSRSAGSPPSGGGSALDLFLTWLFRLLWAWRVELTTITVPVLAWVGLVVWWPDGVFYRWAALALVLTLCAVVLVKGRSRSWLVRCWLWARQRRKLKWAQNRVVVPNFQGEHLKVDKKTRTLAGWEVRARLPLGATVEDVQAVAKRLASAMGLRAVRPLPDPDEPYDTSRVQLWLLNPDPPSGFLGGCGGGFESFLGVWWGLGCEVSAGLSGLSMLRVLGSRRFGLGGWGL